MDRYTSFRELARSERRGRDFLVLRLKIEGKKTTEIETMVAKSRKVGLRSAACIG